MYDTLITFLGEPPEGCEPFLYFALVLVSEFYSFLRIFVMRLVSKYARS